MSGKNLYLVAIILAVLLVGGLYYLSQNRSEDTSEEQAASTTDEVVVREVRPATNYVGAKVAREELEEGCDTGKDCIPSIDQPVIAPASEVEWLSPDDRVIGLVIGGEARAYPVPIMTTYELVNDVIQDRPVLVTYCSLCGSYYAFDPVVDGVHTQFGASGHLQHSCMIMYDRYEGSLWQQMTGDAVVGEAARRDEVLTRLPVTVTTWAQWQEAHPDTGVMMPPAGEREAIGARYQRFADYESSALFFVPAEREFQETDRYLKNPSKSTTLAPKDTVFGVILPGKTLAVSAQTVQEEELLVPAGTRTLRISSDMQTGMVVAELLPDDQNDLLLEQVPVQQSMWFAWEAYFPETEVIEE